MASSLDASDRPATPRERHRHRTREEILDAALAVMTEQGVAALNLTEVARRVGLRQPSLYQYFDSRISVYDALFERGMRTHRDLLANTLADTPDGWSAVRAAARATLRFATEQPVLAQLLFTPAVPGFVPSTQAYAPSRDVAQLMHTAITAAVEHGELHPAAESEKGIALLIAIVAGIASQQNANDAGSNFDNGRFVALLDPALDMYAAYFHPDHPETWTPWP
jgi:AcrR family transcriptional regulator